MKNFDESTLTNDFLGEQAAQTLCAEQDEIALVNSDASASGSLIRRGLAPLEVVMVLPLLMMFMGVIVIFGYAASWKIRSEVVGRDVAWKLRYPRHTSYRHTTRADLYGSRILELHERSPEWPEARDENERLESHRDGGSSIADYVNHEVVVAPIIRGELPEISVNERILDFTRGISQGAAEINRPSPIMAEMGRVDFLTRNSFMDDEFQYTRMSWQTPRGDSVSINGYRGRRLPVIWELELDNLYDDQFVSGLIFTINDVRDPMLMAIDEDMDFYFWKRRLVRAWHERVNGQKIPEFVMNPTPFPPDPRSYRFIPDFSPSWGVSEGTYRHELRRGWSYELDRDWVLENVVQPHLDRLPGKASEMAGRTVSLFREVLSYNERGDCSPPLSQSEISYLERSIEQLRSWRQGL